MSGKRVLVPLAEGFEEIETVTPVDLLRRAAVTCVLAAVGEQRLVTGRSGLRLQADAILDELEHELFDGVLIPGGPATARLRGDRRLLELVKRHAAAEKLLAAICAAPVVLSVAGVLSGRRYTAHDSVRGELPQACVTPVVIDGTLITSRGAGTALPFGLALVSALTGQHQADEVAKAIHYDATAWRADSES